MNADQSKMVRAGQTEPSGQQGSSPALPKPEAPPLSRLALRGSLWTVAGYGAGRVLQLAGNLILTRLLFPEVFGLIALLTVFSRGLQMFSDLGIGPSIIQNPRGDDPRFLNTAWTIQIIRGFALALCCVLLAWPTAWVFARNDPAAWHLLTLIPVFGIAVIIAGFNSTRLFTLNREVVLGRLTVLELVTHAVGLTVSIGWAAVRPTVWAIVAGWLVANTAKMVLSHLVLPGIRNRLDWDRSAAHALFHFGKWVFISTILAFCAAQSDRLILGSLVPLDVLGVYSVGLVLAWAPAVLVYRLATSVLFPVISDYARTDGARLGENLLRARSVLLQASVTAVLGIVLFAPDFFQYLYDERYHSAGWMAQLVSISAWFVILRSTADRALLAIGDSRTLALSNLVSTVLTVIASIGGFRIFGMPGLILGIAAGAAAGHVVIQVALARRGVTIVGQDLKYTALIALLAPVGLLLSGQFGTHLVGDGHPLLRLIAPAILVAAVGVATLRQGLGLASRR